MSDDFEKIFENLTKQHDPNKIFNEFLDYVIDINLFTTINQNLDFEGREADYMSMFKAWVEITNNALNNGKEWYDYLGEFYEGVVQTKFKASNRGQFFTPSSVCDMMSELTILERDCSNKFFNDCCCGSGRLLLSSHTRAPGNIMIGADLDDVACKAAVLNFFIHGVRGSIIHMNTLELECFGAWRVNNYLGYGLPVPHIELIDPAEAHDFIGVSNESDLKCVEVNSPVKESVQTKLI